MKYLSRAARGAPRREWWDFTTLLPGCDTAAQVLAGGPPAPHLPPQHISLLPATPSSAPGNANSALVFPQRQEPQYKAPRAGLSSRVSSRDHVCPSCHYQALSRSKLIVHMRCHSGEKPYACHVCPYRSINRGNLTAHMRTHEGQEPYRCSKCDFRAKFRKELMYHLTLVHNAAHER